MSLCYDCSKLWVLFCSSNKSKKWLISQRCVVCTYSSHHLKSWATSLCLKDSSKLWCGLVFPPNKSKSTYKVCLKTWSKPWVLLKRVSFQFHSPCLKDFLYMLVVIPSNDSKSSHLVFVTRMLYAVIVFFFIFAKPCVHFLIQQATCLCLKTCPKPCVLYFSSSNKQHSLCLKICPKPWVLYFSSSKKQRSLCLKDLLKAVGTFLHPTSNIVSV